MGAYKIYLALKRKEMADKRVNIRPAIKKIGTVENKLPEERFQNVTLRPIIKMQHDLLVAFFQNYLSSKKIDLDDLTMPKKVERISKIFKNDTQFKTELRGLIIGHFTVEEYTMYQEIATETNRRIISIVKERILSVYD